jgi:hypothetical protein
MKRAIALLQRHTAAMALQSSFSDQVLSWLGVLCEPSSYELYSGDASSATSIAENYTLSSNETHQAVESIAPTFLESVIILQDNWFMITSLDVFIHGNPRLMTAQIFRVLDISQLTALISEERQDSVTNFLGYQLDMVRSNYLQPQDSTGNIISLKLSPSLAHPIQNCQRPWWAKSRCPRRPLFTEKKAQYLISMETDTLFNF